MSPYTLNNATLHEVLPIWDRFLWPGRTTPIKDKSSLTIDGDIDMSIYNRPPTLFWTITANREVIAVNSGFWSHDREFRSRGLYVHLEHRGNGLAKKLLLKCLEYAETHGAKTAWSLPRENASHAYRSAGFQVNNYPPSIKMEYGPNMLAVKKLNTTATLLQ